MGFYAACIGAKNSLDDATACASAGGCDVPRVMICETKAEKSDATVECTFASLVSGLRSRDLTSSGGYPERKDACEAPGMTTVGNRRSCCAMMDWR
jgi:hypothetical protein